MANSRTVGGSSSVGGSISNSASVSASQSAQHTNTAEEGGSHSFTSGGSHTHSSTVGGSDTRSHSEGGAHGEQQGKSWASGVVDERTLAKRDQYADYTEDQKVTDTYNRLQETINKRPGAFSSAWDDKLADTYDQLVNGPKFNYNFNEDALYRMYSQEYRKRGQDASRDVLGQATALTGGYNNSYAQSVAQQRYQDYLLQLNDIIPDLQNAAYQRYLADRSDLRDQFNMAQQLRSNEYNQYRDTVSDWQSDRSFDLSAYQDERNFDRNAYQQDRAYWQQEYWNQRNAEQSNASTQDSTNWNDAISHTDYWEESESDSSFWQQTDSSSWANTVQDTFGNSLAMQFARAQENNWNNSNHWSNTMSGGGGSGSGSSGLSSMGRNWVIDNDNMIQQRQNSGQSVYDNLSSLDQYETQKRNNIQRRIQNMQTQSEREDYLQKQVDSGTISKADMQYLLEQIKQLKKGITGR